MKHRPLACSSAIIVALATTRDKATILADKTVQTFRRNVFLVNKHDHHDISYKPPTEIFDLGFAFLRAGFLSKMLWGQDSGLNAVADQGEGPAVTAFWASPFPYP